MPMGSTNFVSGNVVPNSAFTLVMVKFRYL